jgi:predicted site-specific integrase-resolvase
MNYQTRGPQRLVREVLSGAVERIVLVTKDRLLRFGRFLVVGSRPVHLGGGVIVLTQQPEAPCPAPPKRP